MNVPGDSLVPNDRGGYTMGITIHATPRAVWPWLVQMGQGRAGFYTHEWVESLLRADIHNADEIVPDWQRLKPGDVIRLTPAQYLGRPGQALEVSEVLPEQALVFRQELPRGGRGTWAFVLIGNGGRGTRLLFRRRTERLSLFDRVMLPGYVFMDSGMLRGIKKRAEGQGPNRVG